MTGISIFRAGCKCLFTLAVFTEHSDRFQLATFDLCWGVKLHGRDVSHAPVMGWDVAPSLLIAHG